MGEFHSAVVKITGDAFVLGDDTEPSRLAEELEALKSELPGPLVVCVGGGAGNRGRDVSPYGLERLEADENGMVASVLNASVLVEAFEGRAIGFTGVPQYVLEQHAKHEKDPVRKAAIGSAIINLPDETELRPLKKAMDPTVKQDILVAGGGIGRGHVSTDFGAALFSRALVSPDTPTALLKGTNQEGLYTADPRINPSADFLRHASYEFCRQYGLQVVDLAAWPMLESGDVTTFIYKDGPGRLSDALSGAIGSRVDNQPMIQT
jgi:uridylate kinase